MTAIVGRCAGAGWVAPDQGFWSLPPDAFGKCAVPHTITVDVAAWVPRKLEAIGAHRTQMGTAHPFSQLSPDDAAAMARTRVLPPDRQSRRPATPVIEQL